MAFSFENILLGFRHILDWNAYDHLVFLLALCAPYDGKDWKRVAWLVTAFTLGHSLTLALAGLDVLRFSSNWIEFLIPCTIAFTSVHNLVRHNRKPLPRAIYPVVIVFGCVHGMGFSSYFRMMSHSTSELLGGLLAFNLGIEIGQVLLVAVLLVLVGWIDGLGQRAKTYRPVVLSLIALGIAVFLIKENFPYASYQ